MNARKSVVFAVAAMALGGGLAFAPTAGAAPAASGSVTPAVYGCSYTTAEPDLSYGDSGSAVRQAQCLLKYWGKNPGSIDGDFGTKTLSAVKSFQSTFHTLCDLDVDGLVGPMTWHALTHDGC